MKKKLLSLILALLMTSSSFTMIACGESEVNKDNSAESTPSADDKSTETTDDASNATPGNSRLAVPDDLPDVTYNGSEFRVVTKANNSGFDFNEEICVDELNGEADNDAIFNRNLLIENRFDVKILCTPNNSSQDLMVQAATAGTDDYHIAGYHQWESAIPIMANAALNWLDAPYVDLDKPWHNSLSNYEATINGQLYSICSDLSITSMTCA